MKLVNSSEYSDLYSSLLAMMVVCEKPRRLNKRFLPETKAVQMPLLLNISQQTTRNCVPLERRAKAPKKLGLCPRVG
jgi:hypothetical protein